MIRQTSLLAHQEIQIDGTAINQRTKILRFVRNHPDLTRNEISYWTGIRINAVAGRINELLKLGSIFEDGKKIDPITKKNAYAIKASKIIEVTE